MPIFGQLDRRETINNWLRRFAAASHFLGRSQQRLTAVMSRFTIYISRFWPDDKIDQSPLARVMTEHVALSTCARVCRLSSQINSAGFNGARARAIVVRRAQPEPLSHPQSAHSSSSTSSLSPYAFRLRARNKAGRIWARSKIQSIRV